MKKWLVAAALLLLVVLGAIGWAALNLNRYLDENREFVETKVSEILGRDVRFESLSISFREGLAVRIENLTVSDDPAYSESPFVTAVSALGKVRILPALRGQFDVVRVSLVQPQVTIIRDKAGMNVASLVKSSTAETAPAVEPAPGDAAAIAVALFDIEDGTLNFIDRTADPDFKTVLRQIELHASDLSSATPLRIELSAAVLDSTQSNFSLDGTVGPIVTRAPDQSPVAFELDFGPVDGEIALDLARSFGVPQDVSIQGPVSLAATINGTGADPVIKFRFDASAPSVAYADTFRKPSGTPMVFACEASSDGKTVRLPAWTFRLGDSLFEGTAETRLDQSAAYRATVRSAPSKLAPLLAMTGIGTDANITGSFAVNLAIDGHKNSSRPNVEGDMTLVDVGAAVAEMPTIHDYSTQILISSDTLVLEPAELGIGKSKARLDATIRDFSDPSVTFAFESATLALADLGAASAGAARREELRGLSLKGVATRTEGVNFRGTIGVDSGFVRNVEFAALDASLRYTGGKAFLDPMSVEAYGGKLAGKGEYRQTEGSQPTFSVNLRADDVDASKIITARTPNGSLVTGTIDGQLIASGRGEAWESIRTTLDGDGSLTMTGGTIRDVNLAEEVLQGITGLPGLSSLLSPALQRRHPGLFSTGNTTFRDLATKFQLKAGRMFTDGLNLSAADYAIRGAGSIGLDGSVDMNADFRASDALTRNLVSEVGAVKYLTDSSGRLEIPFRLGGTLPAVRAEPDMRILSKALEGALVGGLFDQLLGAPKTSTSGSATEKPGGSDSDGSQQKKQKKKK